MCVMPRLLASSLGITHIERNGHHYVHGFGVAPAAEARAFAQAHPDLYAGGDSPHLAVREGRLTLASLHAATGFASRTHPDWDSLTPISAQS